MGQGTGIAAIAAIGIALVAGSGSAETIIGSDYASNYGGAWTNSSNLGSGFGAWNLYASGGATAGTFQGDSVVDGFGDVNGASPATIAFGMFGQTGYQNAERSLSSPLAVGNTFRVDLATAYRSGAKGISLFRNGAFGGGDQFWNLNVGGDQYTAGGVNQGWAYSQTSVFNLEVTQTSSSSIDISLTRNTDSYSTTISGISQMTGFRLYVGDTTTGGGATLNNLYFNNMVVAVPEPAMAPLVIFGLLVPAVVSYRKMRLGPRAD